MLLKYSQNIFIQYLPLHTLCLTSIISNDYNVDIEKPDGIVRALEGSPYQFS